jgi:hypothetical protein
MNLGEAMGNLPKGQPLALLQKIVDMIRIWKVFGFVISGEEELP